jgi:plastocyanin
MRLFLVLAAIFVTAPAWSQQSTLKLRFVYDGPVIKPEPIRPDKDVQFCGQHPLVNERLLINPENKGIKNAVLYVYTGRGGTKLPPQSPSDKTHELANDKCRFEPRIVFVQVGDTLKITNPDDVGHNANLNFFANQAQNITIPPKAEKSIKIAKPEPAPIPVDCNIHPWMRAYVVALDHPFAGISDDDGAIEINGLPAGQELTFRLYHEAADGAIKEVKIDGKSTELKKNMLELTLKPGDNDLGTVSIPAAALKP